MHNVLYQNVSMLSILLLRINTLRSKSIITFWHRKSQTKNHQYSQKLFELYQFFMDNFLYQNVPKPKLLTT